MKTLTIGIGCRRGATAAQIEAAIRSALDVLEALDPSDLPSSGMPDAVGSDLAGRINDPIDERISCVASIDAKADEPGLLAFCAAHSLPLRLYSRRAISEGGFADESAGLSASESSNGSADLPAATAFSAPSAAVRARFGLNGVCEPCALLASAPNGRLLVAKTVLGGVAVAIAGAC